MTLTHPSTLCRTCDAIAVLEVHALHALGEHELVDSTCGEGEESKKDQMRNEEARAAGRTPYTLVSHHEEGQSYFS